MVSCTSWAAGVLVNSLRIGSTSLIKASRRRGKFELAEKPTPATRLTYEIFLNIGLGTKTLVQGLWPPPCRGCLPPRVSASIVRITTVLHYRHLRVWLFRLVEAACFSRPSSGFESLLLQHLLERLVPLGLICVAQIHQQILELGEWKRDRGRCR